MAVLDRNEMIKQINKFKQYVDNPTLLPDPSHFEVMSTTEIAELYSDLSTFPEFKNSKHQNGIGGFNEEEILKLSDIELRKQLTTFGVDVGPIIESTRKVYEKKLIRIQHDKGEENNIPCSDDSVETTRTTEVRTTCGVSSTTDRRENSNSVQESFHGYATMNEENIRPYDDSFTQTRQRNDNTKVENEQRSKAECYVEEKKNLDGAREDSISSSDSEYQPDVVKQKMDRNDFRWNQRRTVEIEQHQASELRHRISGKASSSRPEVSIQHGQQREEGVSKGPSFWKSTVALLLLAIFVYLILMTPSPSSS